MKYNVVYRDEDSRWKVRRTQYAGSIKLEARSPQAAVDRFRTHHAGPGHVVTQVNMPKGGTSGRSLGSQVWVEVDDWD